MSEEKTSGEAKGATPPRPPGIPKTRSPNFPALTLEVAIQRARQVLRAVGRIPTSEEVLANVWSLSNKSSTFRLSIAALRAYGLLSDQPGPKGDLLKISPLALDILEDFPAGSPQQREAIQKAAVSPRIHNTLYVRYGPTLPADAEVRRYLIREHEPPFNDNTVDEFIAKYKTTISYAGFGACGKIEGEAGIEGGQQKADVNVGDLVQWVSAGADMFPEPRSVLGFSDDGLFAFVPGTSTGLPVSQLTVVGRAMNAGDQKAAPPNPFASVSQQEPESKNPPLGFKEDAYDLAEGRAVLRWPEKLDAGSVEELEDWFTLIVRKMRRTNGLEPRK
jgi:hypothetical protein